MLSARKFKYALLISITCLFSWPAFGQQFDSIIPANLMTSVGPWAPESGGIFVMEFDTPGTSTGCSSPTQAAFFMNAPAASAMRQLAVTAFNKKLPLQIYTEGCMPWAGSPDRVPIVVQIRLYSSAP